jgi:hypothetical protein
MKYNGSRNPAGCNANHRKEAAVLLRQMLADGEWHEGEHVKPAVALLVPCGVKTVEKALRAIGGERRWRLKANGKQMVPRRADWRLPLEADDGAPS